MPVLVQPFAFVAVASGCVVAFGWETAVAAAAAVVVAAATAAVVVDRRPSCEAPADPWARCPSAAEATSSSAGSCRRSLERVRVAGSTAAALPLEPSELPRELRASVVSPACLRGSSSLLRRSCPVDSVPASPSRGAVAASIVPELAKARAVSCDAAVREAEAWSPEVSTAVTASFAE